MSDHVIRIHDIELRTGTVIQDRYEVTSHLGTGGFAQVFEAFDRNIERPVAIKFLNLHASTTDPNAANNILARFKREAKLAAKIQHPNVVNIFDFGLVGQNRNIPYIVMELLSGHDLEVQIYKKGAIAPERALPLFVDCLEALGEAHKMGIVHKDLKPSNLFLSNPGERSEALRIVDFGIAHIRDAREGRLTATGEILGTPQYLSPEYIEAQIVSPAFDVYQMGLILVETLTGSAVVDEAHPLRCVKAHSMGELDLPTALLDSPLGPIIACALHIDHTARFANAEEFADALAEIDPASLPKLGSDMPKSRLAHAGTLDSDSRIMNSRTGQMPQPTTGQMSANGSGTKRGYAQMQVDGSHFDDVNERPTAQHARAQQGPTDQVHRSTEAAIAEAGIGKRGLKALALLGVAVVVLGGVAAWLLVSKLDDAEKSSDEQVATAQAEAPTNEEPAATGPEKEQPAEAQPAETQPAEAAGLAAAAGEAPADKPTPVEITVDTSPSGATVYRGSTKLGTAPVAVRFESADDEPIALKVSRRGYETKEISLRPDADPSLTVELDKKARVQKHRKPARTTAKKAAPANPAKSEAAAKPTPAEKVEATVAKTVEKPVEKQVEEEDDPQRMLIAP